MVKNTSFFSDLFENLSIGSKLPDVFQKVSVLFSIKFGTKNFFFGDSSRVIYGIGTTPIKYIISLIKESDSSLVFKDIECLMKFDGNYFLYFDINYFASKEDLSLVFIIINNFLKNYERFESIYGRFKYLKSLVFSIEPLIYEVSLKNALSQSLISLTTFTDIEKSVVASISKKRIDIISSIGIEKKSLESKDIMNNIKEVILTKRESFFLSRSCGDGKKRLVGIIPLGDFNEIKGILFVGFEPSKEKITDIDKEILKILSFVITHRIKLHELNIGLVVAKKKAEELSKLKSQFVANVSHELRTPLNAILGFVELLKIGDFTKEDQSRYLDYIMSAGTSLLNMINNILDLSKIEAGGMKPIFTEISLDELLEDITKYGEVLAKNKGIEFIVIKHTGNIVLVSDYSMVKSILMNLISNAIKFTDSGWVKVSVYQKDGKLIFKVEDTGIGMKEEDLEKIFSPFTQLEDVRSKKFPGTGIGLSLSSKFAEMIKGKIIPKTKGLGKGCIFYFILPTES